MQTPTDHTRRRTQIIDAVLDVVATGGLDKVTMRSVANTAGVSLRLVQYYFGTKEQLMRDTLHHLEDLSRQRWQRRRERLGPHARPRDLLEEYLAEALPTDNPSRQFHTVYRTFAAAALTDPALTIEPISAGPRRTHTELTAIIASALGSTQSPRDPATEAHHLMALEHGLSTGILTGLHDLTTAQRILQQHLDSVVGP